MNLQIELNETDLKRLVVQELRSRLGEMPLDESKVHIYVKSKQNYKSEWEEAAFRANYIASV